MVLNEGVSVEKGCFSYGQRELLHDVTFDVSPREVLTILGPNGAGKTTLLKCMMGLNTWDSGASYVDGRDISKMPLRNVSRHIAYVPQLKTTSFDYTVREVVMMGRSCHIPIFSTPGEKDTGIVENTISRLGIEHIADRKYNTLSGGEMQLVMIARALVSEPSILVLDEPESNLDYYNQLKVLELIREISKEMSCIINTHYPEHAMGISHKTMMLDGKGDYLYGRTEEIITEENIERIFSVKAIIGQVERESSPYKYIIPISLRR